MRIDGLRCHVLPSCSVSPLLYCLGFAFIPWGSSYFWILIPIVRLEETTKLTTRREMPHHQEIAKLIRDEDLLRAPLKYLTLEDRGVWSR